MRLLRVGLRLSLLAAQRPGAPRLALGLRAAPAVVPRITFSGIGSRGFATSRSVLAEKDAQPQPKPNIESKEVSKSKENGEVAESKEPEPKLTIWQKVKKEAKHYWEGTKLLGYEVKISTKLAFKLASGRELSRREDRQLKRTIQDIVRVLPFSVFILVPFAELLLPIALRLFPNMLPSVYETSSAKKKKAMKLGKTRSDVGTYLRGTIKRDTMKLPEFKSKEQQTEFEEFFRQVRDGEKPSQERLITVARMFKDDMLLDNFTRPQLAALAKYMNLQAFGTSIILRYQIRHRMRMIKQDDRVIDYEGVDSLNTLELQSACQSRGFKVYGVSTGRLRDDLTNWLQLRLHDRVPSTLLVLSSAYSYDGKHNLESMYDGVLSVLGALPPEVYHEAELEVNMDSATNAQRLEVLKEQDELIRDENKEEQESGHVVQVRDDLNVDDEERQPEPTESEADAKADLAWYDNAEDKAKASKKSNFTSFEESREDNEFTKPGNKPSNPQPTASEDSAKADMEWESAAPPPPSQPTMSEESSKADLEWQNYKKPSDPQPTSSEESSKADMEWEDHHEAKKGEHYAEAAHSATTDSEGAVKADNEWSKKK